KDERGNGKDERVPTRSFFLVLLSSFVSAAVPLVRPVLVPALVGTIARRLDACLAVVEVDIGCKNERPPRQAMISRIGLPWSISRRLRPGISSFRESRPSWRRMVAWMSVT